MTPIVVPKREVASSATDVPWRVLLWVSLGLAIIGFADAGLLWMPFAFGDATWRMNTISATIDALPLATVAVTILFAASASDGSGRGLWTVALVSTVLFALIVLLLVMYGRGAFAPGPEAEQVAAPALARTIMFGGVYVIIYALLAIAAFGRIREQPPALLRS